VWSVKAANGNANGTANGTDASIEWRYLGLVQLSNSISGVGSWQALAAAIAGSLATIGAPAPVRLWGNTPEGLGELARDPPDAELAPIAQRELRAAAERPTASLQADGTLLFGLHASGVSMGVLEVGGATEHSDFLAQAAPIVASTTGLLAAQGAGDAVLEPLSVEAASDTASVMAAFAEQARRLLDHDRLSAYLLTPNRHAFERFAVATSPIIPGEGVVIPFEELGLRHIVITNKALVSEDLSADPRIVGREDRVIARAGFRGLLSAPLRREGRPVGVLNFVSKTPGFYRNEDIPIAQQMADQVSAFLENLRRQRRMRALVMHAATERERGRLSRDLFDTVAQAVPAISTIAGGLRKRLASVDKEAAEEARKIVELGENQLADIRRAIIGMSPRALESKSLEDVVESTLAQFRDATGLKASWTIRGDTVKLPSAVGQAVYRILQEALANVRFHAKAESLRVQLVVDEGLTLVVEDDGVGFDAEAEAEDAGMGLQGMVERASALGGSFSIDTAPDAGTRARLDIPAVGDAGSLAPSHNGGASPKAPDDAGTLRVFVAERNCLIRAGLVQILERSGGIRVVGEASSADEIRGQVARFSPDVILLDEQLEPQYSLKLTEELKLTSPSSAILITARNTVGAATELLEAGGTGIIHKSIEPEELVDAVRAVANGARLIARPHGSAEDQENGASPLSRREREILSLVAAGHTNAEIAEALFFATKTVERHVATIVGKLGARNRAHAVALAVAHQIIDVDDR
jgi:signal transduction histidine kinase/DNA-binding NarL/FixJ family response regulator